MTRYILPSIKKSLFYLALPISLGLLVQTAVAQEKEQVIPFQLTTYNNLSFEAILNKKDTVHLMLHTAFAAVGLTETATARLHSLRFDRVDSLQSWGGHGDASRFSKSNSLQMGSLHWEDMPIWEDKNTGWGMDGKFGMDLFKNKVVEINFDKKCVVLRDSLPATINEYEKLRLSFENDYMFIEVGCATGQGILNHRFLLHSGYSGALLLDDRFVADNHLGEQLKITNETQMRDSFDHILKVKKAILPAFIIGKEQLPDVPVGFFEGAIGRQKMSAIGGDILKRFNIIIDAQRAYIYLKPNGLYGSPHTNA